MLLGEGSAGCCPAEYRYHKFDDALTTFPIHDLQSCQPKGTKYVQFNFFLFLFTRPFGVSDSPKSRICPYLMLRNYVTDFCHSCRMWDASLPTIMRLQHTHVLLGDTLQGDRVRPANRSRSYHLGN